MVFLEGEKRRSTLAALLKLICDADTPVVMCRGLLTTLSSYQNSVS